MDYRVPALSIGFMAVSALAGAAIPVLLFVYFRKKHRADILPFFVGCAVFAVFALLLEGSIHRLVFAAGVGAVIRSDIWFYGIYGGVMAGLFEETGRYAAFQTVLKKRMGNDRNALMYGAGHGGFEAFYILVLGMVSNLVMAVKLNAGMADTLTAGVTDPATLQALNAAFAALAQTAPPVFLLGIVERIAAVAIHLSCSVLVWFAAKNGGRRFWYYPLAVLLHALVDICAVVLSRYTSRLWVILGAVTLLAAVFVVIAAFVWKTNALPQGILPEGGAGDADADADAAPGANAPGEAENR